MKAAVLVGLALAGCGYQPTTCGYHYRITDQSGTTLGYIHGSTTGQEHARGGAVGALYILNADGVTVWEGPSTDTVSAAGAISCK